ncbi:DUF6286 domain-containing protein [Corynebacterium sp.]|uniref:DUF6286 domain-containing protein n=1 Tax=Corynebacterium sp. TaxID=1720 RepID=UPI0026DB1151|nr:DUF6286 domain-containing protein [Corynebacterium sp.]MDO5032361.1 DUF6286 domain-containing protein [Corynebacterium sp.]
MSSENLPVGFGQRPKASPPARGWTVVLGVAFLALAAVTGHEAWVVAANEGGTPWLQPLIDLMARGELETWMLYVAGAVVLLGLILLWAALAPRKNTHVRVSSDTASIWTRAVDIARLSSATTRRVPGVVAARSRALMKAKKPRLTVTVTGDVADSELKGRVSTALEQALARVEAQPQLTIELEKTPEVGENV